MTRTLAILLRSVCCAALLWAGSAVALELQVAMTVGYQGGKPAAKGAAGAEAGARSSRIIEFNEALAREICRRINAKCVMSGVPFKEMIPGLESHRFQMGFGNFLRTPEREARVAFSQSLWNSSSRLLARRETITRTAASLTGELRLEALRDLRIAVLAGSQQEHYVQGVAAAQGLKVQGVQSLDACLDAVRQGQADFALVPILNAYVLFDSLPGNALEFVGPAMVDNGLGGSVHIALPRDNPGLLAAVDGALAGMRRDGSYQRIWRQYFPFQLY